MSMLNKRQTLAKQWQRFSDRWLVYQTDDAAKARTGYMVSAVTLIFATLGMVVLPILMVFSSTGLDWMTLSAPFVFLGLYFLTRRGYVNLVGITTIGLVVLLSPREFGDFSSITNVGLLMLALSIVLSGLLIGSHSMFVTALIVGIMNWYASAQQYPDDTTLGPFLLLLYLTIAMATYLVLEQLQRALDQSERDALALKEAKDSLAEQVVERTKELQNAFDMTSLVSGIIIESPDQDRLFRQIVELIQKTMDAYRVRIYLHDSISETLTQAASQFGVGRQSDAADRSIPWGKGIIGAAAAQNKALRIANTALVSEFIQIAPNEVYAEMAIPLQQDEQIFGVLDLQRRLDKSFSEADLALMQGVANQLSVAINNLRLVDETRQALDRVEALNRRLIQGRWEATLKDKSVIGYAYSPLEVKPVADEWLDGMIRLLAMGTPMEHTAGTANDSVQPIDELAVPVKLRGEVIGVLGMTREADQAWTQDEMTIAHSIAGQIGLALENARLFEETSRRAGREKVIADVTRQVWSSENLENIMQTAVAQLGDVLTASKVVIQLGTEEQLMAIPSEEMPPPVNGAG